MFMAGFRPTMPVIIAIGVAIAAGAVFAAFNLVPKEPLEVNVVTYTESMGGVDIQLIRVKLTNNSGMPLTNVVVDMGMDDVQTFPRINNGESIFITPKNPDKVEMINVNTDEGISITKRV